METLGSEKKDNKKSIEKIFNKIKEIGLGLATKIRRKGLRGLGRKFIFLTGYGLAVVPVLLVRLLRPWILIRFGILCSHRIGHFVSDAEFYLCERELGLQNPKAIDLFSFGGTICNTQWAKMCKRAMRFNMFVRCMHRVNLLIPGGKIHNISIIAADRHWSRDIDGVLRRTPVHMSFTPEEEKQGQQALRAMGLPGQAEFICFHARDSAYLDTVYPEGNWKYHDYRNSNILNYIKAVELLTKRRVYSFRMGAIVKDKIDSPNPMVIDYATRFRSDFLDIYLSARCKFFLTSGTGVDAVAMAFRRPLVYVNVLPFEFIHSWSAEYISIPKKFWLVNESRFMRFQEILNSGAGRFLNTQDYQSHGINVLENTEDEIAAVAIEMDERLRGVWKTSEEDEWLQKKFWSHFKPSWLHGAMLSRVGADFLRQNRDLLD
jgi:putative glycosyltransferase (TIGR04372 family)